MTTEPVISRVKAQLQASKFDEDQQPFPHCVIDDFFSPQLAEQLEAEMPPFNSQDWHTYSNPIEEKKTCNNWNIFPATTYEIFATLNSHSFCELLSMTLFQTKGKVHSDPGLNGGGWHIHGRGGLLNPHLDYSLHPKLKMQRKLNLIIYLSKKWQPDWGGALGFWSGESNVEPGALSKVVQVKFNRAILFDTTQNSWHGLLGPITCPDDTYRKSMAVYYLVNPPENVDPRGKALFAPTDKQKGDEEIEQLIKARSSISEASKSYIW